MMVSNIVYFAAILPLTSCPYPLINQGVIIVLRRIRVTTRAKDDITFVAAGSFNEHRAQAERWRGGWAGG